MTDVEATQEEAVPEKKIVWMACRATEGCKGNHAEIVMIFGHRPVGAGQGPGPRVFNAAMGGKTVRYCCMTCKMPFHITN